MINLLSAEWYKLVRSKSFSICIAVVVCAVALMYGVLSLMVEAREEFSMMELTCQIFSGDLMPCVLAIFVSIFVTGEYESGMMKNVVGKGRERRKIFLSKLIVTELAVIPLILAGIGAGLLGGLWFKGSGAFTVDFWKNFGVYVGLQLLMEIALAGVFVLSSDLCRNYAAGISLGIGISAFPMSSRVIEKLGQEADPQNHLLMHAIAANVSGQIASVVAGGVVLQYFANMG